MWVQLTNHIQLIPLGWWGDHSPRVWNGRALPGKRTVTGLETAKSSVCIAPHLCCTLGQPLRAPVSLLFIYLLCPRRRILLRCILPFRLRNRWHAEHGTSSFCCFLSSSSLHPLHFWLTLVLLSAERRRCVGENLQPRHYYCDRK
jgi:hypothetical protein